MTGTNVIERNLYADAVVGRTGLGNMLFPWARAEIFCRDHGARMLAVRWTNVFRVGPWLRRERDKRYYFRHFTNRSYICGPRRMLASMLLRRMSEQDALRGGLDRQAGLLIVEFRGMEGLFKPLAGSREFISRRLHEIVHPRLREKLRFHDGEPYIAVHVRRGDFRPVTNPVAQSGGMWNYQISDEWYSSCIAQCRRALGADFPVVAFSDAKPAELDGLRVRVRGLQIAPPAEAIVDILRLSGAEVLVCSNSSFSLWAQFLGGMPSIWHPGPVRQRLSELEVEASVNGELPDEFLSRIAKRDANEQSST